MPEVNQKGTWEVAGAAMLCLRLTSPVACAAREVYNRPTMTIGDDNMKALSAFAAVGGEFCEFVDSLHAGRMQGMYRALEMLLARLHSAILPVEIEMPENEHPEHEKPKVETAEEIALAKRLAVTFGNECDALHEWHVGFEDDENHCAAERAGTLPDDIASIYWDIRRGLVLWNLGTPDAQAESAWEWRFGYEHHWGDHLFRAVTTVHEARYQAYAD
jgi:hypothetical protein